MTVTSYRRKVERDRDGLVCTPCYMIERAPSLILGTPNSPQSNSRGTVPSERKSY